MLPDVEVKDVHYVTSSANRCTMHVGLFKCLVNSADYNFISETNRKQNYQQHYHDADDELIDMRVSFAICTTVFTLANRNVFVGIYAEEEEEEEEYKN